MILACLLVAVWLLCGICLRSLFAIFDRIYIPPSVIGGFVGLAVIQGLGSGKSDISASLDSAASELRAWPAILIAVVFAAMLLPRATAPWKQSAQAAGREALMVWIIVLGQTAIGLLATGLIIQPFYDVPNSFGMLLETGFAGGHGTAAAMGQVFASPHIGLPEGLDLGLLMATVGLIYGTLSGILWINLAVHWGWVSRQRSEQPLGVDEPAVETMRHISQRQKFARGIDPLLVQAIWIAVAYSVGFALQTAIGTAAAWADAAYAQRTHTAVNLIGEKLSFVGVLGSFPLFVYTLLGGLIVRKILKALKLGQLIDEHGLARWTSIAMDLLVVAAIATLDITSVIKLAIPFLILVGCGVVWTAFCLLVLSRRVLRCEHWFELGLINYGMSTGTTATGFILLRIVDPDLKTDAAKDYAIAAPFSAPFVGGGILTIGLPLLLLEQVAISISSLVLTAIVIGMIVFAIGRRPGQDLQSQ